MQYDHATTLRMPSARARSSREDSSSRASYQIIRWQGARRLVLSHSSSLLRSGLGRASPSTTTIHSLPTSKALMRRSHLIWSDNFAWHPPFPRRKERHNGYRLLPVVALGITSGVEGSRGTRSSKSRYGPLSLCTPEAAKCHCQRPKRLSICRFQKLK